MSKGTEYTLKVMEDLDALLADLQSTTTQNLYNQQGQLWPQNSAGSGPGGVVQDHQTSPVGKQNQPTSSTILQQRQNYQTSPSLINNEQLRSSQTPPPLPPPPQDILDTIPPPQQFDDQPLYEIQNSRCDNSISGSSQGSGNQAYQYSRDTSQAMSMISNNLSELDQLLNDLNSAQFMAEVDKKHTQTTGKLVPPVAPKPGKGISNVGGSTVDSLLDHLETAVPSDQNGGYPVIKNATATNYTYQSAGFHERNQPSRYEELTNAPLQPQQSVATQELDDLMATLSDFKMKDKGPNSIPAQQGPVRRSPSPGSEPSYAKPQKSRNQSQSSSANSSIQSGSISGNSSVPGGQLESMLGDLQSDLSKQGVNTKTKGLCAACNQPVVGQVITALGKIWHIEHFTCAHCHETLGTKNFYERDGVAYCERDYHSLFAPRCAYCNGPIVDKCVTALTKTWHPEHFFCAQCGRPFGEEGFHERDGKAYCRADFFEMFAPKCGGCGCAIVDNYISALNRHWHPECFACWDCHQPFGGGSFFDYEGLPYCETHYHAKRGSLCAGCQKPISGRCITAMYKKFHPEHFVCAFCLKQLNKGTFKEQNDRPYCHPCFVKLFG